jgi:chemotaxis protein MotA
MDIATLLGFVIAMGAVFGSFVFEGGKLGAILQPTAFIIVMGGTIGALFVQFPMNWIVACLKGIKGTVLIKKHNNLELIKAITGYAQKARREGVVALEGDASGSKDPFMKKALGLAVDGTESRLIRDAMEIELTVLNEEGEMACKVMEAGGGYCPTIGILGAVLGLINVMSNLADPAKLGGGIATAFVATVYGVFFANIVFLPLGTKLKFRHLETMMAYELTLAGVLAIVDGENPRIIEQKLQGYLGEHKPHGPADGKAG